MPMMIAFDKVTYRPGHLVSGHVVVVRRSSPQKIKGLSLRILGRANRLVSDPENPIRAHRKELYFDDKVDIFGHDGRDSVVGVGETLFPFSFTLPHGLPSSFVWGRGNIMYFVEARLTRSSWKDDKRVSVRLEVEGVYDLNLDPLSGIPGGANVSKYVNHLLTKSGPFAFSFATNKSGFLRGHSIPFQVNIRNLSKVDAKRVKVSLIQEIAQDGKQWSSTVEEIRGPAVPSGEIQAWDGRLKIPADIPPTNLGNLLSFSPVLTLNYFLQVELSAKSATVDSIKTKVPVIIGTIPLSRGRDRLRLQQLQHEETCPLSGNTQSHTPSPSQSQFSPGILIHSSVTVTNQPSALNVLPTCRHCPQQHNLGIYRRLRQLQRRRRESPPPTYDEAVGDSITDSSPTIPTYSPQPHKVDVSVSPGSTPPSPEEVTVTASVQRAAVCSTNEAKVEEEEAIPSTSTSLTSTSHTVIPKPSQRTMLLPFR